MLILEDRTNLNKNGLLAPKVLSSLEIPNSFRFDCKFSYKNAFPFPSITPSPIIPIFDASIAPIRQLPRSWPVASTKVSILL